MGRLAYQNKWRTYALLDYPCYFRESTDCHPPSVALKLFFWIDSRWRIESSLLICRPLQCVLMLIWTGIERQKAWQIFQQRQLVKIGKADSLLRLFRQVIYPLFMKQASLNKNRRCSTKRSISNCAGWHTEVQNKSFSFKNYICS